MKKVQEGRLSRPEAVVALIPAFKPDRLLLDLVRDLRDGGFRSVIVVDDGSPPESAPVFDELTAIPGCNPLRHKVNRGKGRAIKTGLAFFLERYPTPQGSSPSTPTASIGRRMSCAWPSRISRIRTRW